jgi:glycosyltransferase involved in cell wall biosynthesis
VRPLVSIVMPVFNGGHYFSLALESALRQTYSRAEIIVVDDGSTDDGDTERRAKCLGSEVRYIRQVNGGLGAALNTGVEAMRGDIFCWLNHDDLFRPEKTEIQVSYYNRLGNRDAILFSDYTVMDSDGTDLFEVKARRDVLLQAPMMALLTDSINGCTIFIPRHLFESTRPFPEQYRFVQDYRLWNRMLRQYEFLHLPHNLIRYRSHLGQGSRKPDAIVEGEDLWIDMIDSVSEVERAQMLGSSQRFFEFLEAHLSKSPYRLARIHANRRAGEAVTESLVSIIVPVACDGPKASQTVATVLAQAHPNIEVLLVGPFLGGSRIGGSGTDPRLRMITVHSDALADCLNAGLDGARGDYVSICRPGVAIAPDCILRRLAAMQRLGIAVGYEGGPGARDLTTHDLILGSDISLESVIFHRLAIAAGLSFSQPALSMGDSAALLSLARVHNIGSLCRNSATCRPFR